MSNVPAEDAVAPIHSPRAGRNLTRVFAESLDSELIRIEDSEAHHLLNVLRAKSGDRIELFDGTGHLVEAVIESAARRHAEARVVSRRSVPSRRRSCLTVAVSPPKGDRLKWMVEKLTEIGVDRLVLLDTERTVVTPGETRLDKLRANVISACKQSGRVRLMQLEPLTTLDNLLRSSSARRQGEDACVRLVVAHPGVEPAEKPDQSADSSDSPDPMGSGHVETATKPDRVSGCSETLLLIGPEGGFTDSEMETLTAAGAERLGWPDTILRIETAALVFSTLLFSTRPYSEVPQT